MKIAIVTAVVSIMALAASAAQAEEGVRLNGKPVHVGDGISQVIRAAGLPMHRGKEGVRGAPLTGEIWRYAQPDRQIELRVVDGKVAAISQYL